MGDGSAIGAAAAGGGGAWARAVSLIGTAITTSPVSVIIGRVGVTGGARWDGSQVDLDDLVVDLGEGQLGLSGTVTELAEVPVLDVRLVADPARRTELEAAKDYPTEFIPYDWGINAQQ